MKTKKLLAILLSVLMLAAVCPLMAFAATNEKTVTWDITLGEDFNGYTLTVCDIEEIATETYKSLDKMLAAQQATVFETSIVADGCSKETDAITVPKDALLSFILTDTNEVTFYACGPFVSEGDENAFVLTAETFEEYLFIELTPEEIAFNEYKQEQYKEMASNMTHKEVYVKYFEKIDALEYDEELTLEENEALVNALAEEAVYVDSCTIDLGSDESLMVIISFFVTLFTLFITLFLNK